MKFILKSLLMTTMLASLILVTACSSSKERAPEDVENEDIQKDYVVRDSSHRYRPGWVIDAELWAQDKGKDISKFRYFSFETVPQNRRDIACSVAKTRARVDIASEIATFIQKSLGQSVEGRSSIDENDPKTEKMREFLEETLAEKTQAMLHGVQVKKTYWEKRKYLKDKGAKRDFTGYTCSALVRINSKTLSDAIERASQLIVENSDDPDTKENVKQALKDVKGDFEKARKGKI